MFFGMDMPEYSLNFLVAFGNQAVNESILTRKSS